MPRTWTLTRCHFLSPVVIGFSYLFETPMFAHLFHEKCHSKHTHTHTTPCQPPLAWFMVHACTVRSACLLDHPFSSMLVLHVLECILVVAATKTRNRTEHQTIITLSINHWTLTNDRLQIHLGRIHRIYGDWPVAAPSHSRHGEEDLARARRKVPRNREFCSVLFCS